jgi:hypothetical protein
LDGKKVIIREGKIGPCLFAGIKIVVVGCIFMIFGMDFNPEGLVEVFQVGPYVTMEICNTKGNRLV